MTSNAPDCWICRDVASPTTPLVTGLCSCKGSLGSAHQHCIDEFVFRQRRTHCPSCNDTYELVSISSLAAGSKNPAWISLPTTRTSQLFFLLRHLVVPVVLRCAAICAVATLRFALLPFLYGTGYFQDEVQADLGDATEELLRTPVLSSSSSSLSGWWLFFSVMLYGWIAAFCYRAIASGWTGWAAFFRENRPLAEPQQNVRAEQVEANNNNNGGMEGDNDGAEQQNYTHVEVVFSSLAWLLKVVGWTGSLTSFLAHVVPEMLSVTVITVVLRDPIASLILLAGFFVFAIVLRKRHPPRKLKDYTRRLEESNEDKANATQTDVVLWFVTYVCDVFGFSVILPIAGGYCLHYATAPYFCTMPQSFSEVESATFLSLAAHWFAGSLCLMTLVRYESTVIVPLFAPGIDLFFIRSIDLNKEDDLVQCWSFVFSQVYDADPLRMVSDLVRIGLVELSALTAFAAYPVHGTFFLRDFFFGGFEAASTPSLPLATGVWYASPSADGSDGGGAISYLFVAIYVIIYGTFLTCMAIQPVQRVQLKYLRCVTGFLARVLGLEHFLFDPERLSLLDAWLDNKALDELMMPEVPLERMLVRRERFYAASDLPSFLRWRLALFALLFFVVSLVGIWACFLCVAPFVLFLSHSSFAVVGVGFSAPFVAFDIVGYGCAMLQFVAVVVVCVFGGIIQAAVFAASVFERLTIRKLVLETREYLMRVKRSVGKKYGHTPHNNGASSSCDDDERHEVSAVVEDASGAANNDWPSEEEYSSSNPQTPQHDDYRLHLKVD